MSKRALWITVILLAALAGGGAWWYLGKDDKQVQWRTGRVERGDLQVSVTATGTLQALVTVQVGTQVSGPIASIHADFNTEVRKGEVIARLDTTLLHAALEDARSNLARVAAQERQAAEELKRTQALFDRALISQAELDQALASAQVATANLRSARSQVERARINLRYAIITSPIDGIVLSRAVDVGQTVAASFNTPTLFTIAGDLRRMEVKAAVDEADIGRVKEGQKATFTVDAYPEAEFEGTVQQVRLEPKVEQNVVTYDVVIRVPNPDKKLMPGMTANLTIAVTRKENVLLVPSAALRFRPPRDRKAERDADGAGSEEGRRWAAGGARTEGGAGSGGSAGEGGWRRKGRGGDFDSVQGNTGDSATRKLRRGGGEGAEGGEVMSRGRIYLLVDGKPSPVRVRTGLTDGSRTEIEGPVEPGAAVLVGMEGAAAQNAARPFGLQPGGGRRRGF
jgi:HlyD family secretion protein